MIMIHPEVLSNFINKTRIFNCFAVKIIYGSITQCRSKLICQIHGCVFFSKIYFIIK